MRCSEAFARGHSIAFVAVRKHLPSTPPAGLARLERPRAEALAELGSFGGSVRSNL
jgi:hypothetical protein